MITNFFIPVVLFLAIIIVYALISQLVYKNKRKKQLENLFKEQNISEIQNKEIFKTIPFYKTSVFPLCIVLTIIIEVLIFYNFPNIYLLLLFPLPFTLYIIPKTIVEFLEDKKIKLFEKELIPILRRMSSVTKYGSIINALEDLFSTPEFANYSEMTQKCFNKIYNYHKYLNYTIDDAFLKVAEEIPSKNFYRVAASLKIGREIGLDISGIFDRIVYNMQNEELMRAEAKSIMAQTRTTANIMSIIPFLIIGFFFANSREMYLNYLKTFSNQLIFMVVLMFLLMGIYIIQKLFSNKR